MPYHFAPAGSRDWQTPPEAIWPEGTTNSQKAVDTTFQKCEDAECDVEIAGAKVPLQRVTFTLPAGALHAVWAGLSVMGLGFACQDADVPVIHQQDRFVAVLR